jgi:hypothetical protein
MDLIILTIFSDIIDLIEHVNYWHSHLIEHQLAIVDTIQAHFPAHIFNCDTLTRLHLAVTDGYDEGVDSLIFAFNQSLCENNRVVSVTSAICDPIFLRLGCR